jgi:hypothetical protein
MLVGYGLINSVEAITPRQLREKITMPIENQKTEGLDLVAIASDEFAELSVYQQSYVMGRGLNKAISSQAQIIETAALITFGGNTEPEYDTWIAYRDGAIKGHQEDEDAKSGTAPARGPIAAKADADSGRQWFHRYCKKPLAAYWDSQDPAREFIAPLKTPKTPKTPEDKAAEKLAKAKKEVLDMGIAKARTTRDVLTKIVGAATRSLTDALKAGDVPMVKSAKAKLTKIEKAITKAAE